MREVALQIQPRCPHCKSTIRPFSKQDEEQLGEYKVNQSIRAKTYGVKKERSLSQLALYWVLCGIVADNSDDGNWNTKEKVDEQIKIKCRYVDLYMVVDGIAHIRTGSIAFKNLEHLAACRYFDRAFEEMSRFLKVPVKELIREGENLSGHTVRMRKIIEESEKSSGHTLKKSQLD